MKSLFILFTLLALGTCVGAQQTAEPFTITADTVTLTSCDSSELIIRNHTQNIPGFLFNIGNGLTIFKHAVQPIGSGSFLIGADTLNVPSNAWVQGGNAFGSVGILGTLDNNPLDIYTNGTQRARWAARGALLIGTTTDNGNLLQVNGDILVNGLTVGSGKGANNTNSVFGYNAAFVSNSTANGNTAIGYNSCAALVDGSYNTAIGPYALHANQSGAYNTAVGIDAGFFTTGSNNIFLGAGAGQGETGSNKLYIANNGANNLIYGDFSAGRVQINATQYHVFLDSSNFIVNGDTYLSDSLTLGTIRAGTNSDSVLVISNGHVVHKVAQSSIGVAFNGAINTPLAVNGPITAKKLTLSATDWPDYVFDSAYRLPLLKSVESYLHKEHHLPGVPSAAVVQKDGLDVGAGQAALLKKIEELTLYSIDQDKKIAEQNKRQESQDQQLALLKKEVEELKMLIGKKSR